MSDSNPKKDPKPENKDVPEPGSSSKPAGEKMSSKAAESLLDMNAALKNELAGMDKGKATEAVRKMDIAELLTGLSVPGKNQKDMASYKFWQTQPVPHFDDKESAGGPIKRIDPEKVPKEPDQLLEGFEWATLDLTNETELHELWDLLTNHYVEDDNAMFRFRYSQAFLHWCVVWLSLEYREMNKWILLTCLACCRALMSPGWKKEWHVGVRAKKSRKLVASICGVPTDIRVRDQKIRVTEINFLCIHKKLRSKRLTPVLIKEITRRCYLNGIYQAIYTAGVILPTPVSSCRYYHRPLDWLKLYEVGFSPLPHGSTKARQITKNHLPSNTSTPGLRPMEEKDVDAAHDLLERYLKRYDMNPAFTKDEIKHWLLHRPNAEKEQVIWSYVVEDPETHKITDFASFYNLESTVIQHPKHDNVRAAYLYYYATETAFTGNQKALKERLLMLMNDALILAKKVGLLVPRHNTVANFA